VYFSHLSSRPNFRNFKTKFALHLQINILCPVCTWLPASLVLISSAISSCYSISRFSFDFLSRTVTHSTGVRNVIRVLKCSILRAFIKSINLQITNKMHFNVCDVFYSHCSHQHVSACIPVIFRMMLLLKEYKMYKCG